MAAGQDAKPEQPEKMSEASAASRQVQVEKERLTRRAALRKFGFGAGMAALMALSTDDLARMAAKKLQQSAKDNKLANAVAMEFKNAGIAFADPSSLDGSPEHPLCPKVPATTANPYGCNQCNTAPGVPGGHSEREACCNQVYNYCRDNYCAGYTLGQCINYCNSTGYTPCMASTSP